MAEIELRPGRPEDLLACTAVWRSTVDANLPEPTTAYGLYGHELRTGTLLVADHGGTVVGFAASLTRGERWFLADLFVSPDLHGGGVGRRLMQALIDHDRPGPLRATMASTDPRALALYVGVGMEPLWPCFALAAKSSSSLRLSVGGALTVSTASVDELLSAARTAGYGLAREDVDYPVDDLEAGVVLVHDVPGVICGGAVIRWSTPFVIDDPTSVTIGPVFSVEAGLLAEVVAAVVRHASTTANGRTVRVYVPGPSPALAMLLAAGFEIHDFDLFCAGNNSMLDPHRVLPSHDVL